MSTSVLETLPGKLDIKRHSPSILYLLYDSQEEDLTDMQSIGSRIEEKYGHLFDAIIINDNVVEASKELLAVIDQLETRPQWVPITWVQ